ncbi:hypothetical protein KAU11_05820, partial [Candidatus Babeliales bacterium]|nr:hypothetical protein [Candidatus Babeliales bacterium]
PQPITFHPNSGKWRFGTLPYGPILYDDSIDELPQAIQTAIKQVVNSQRQQGKYPPRNVHRQRERIAAPNPIEKCGICFEKLNGKPFWFCSRNQTTQVQHQYCRDCAEHFAATNAAGWVCPECRYAKFGTSYDPGWDNIIDFEQLLDWFRY